jgi:hypothetical protein
MPTETTDAPTSLAHDAQASKRDAIANSGNITERHLANTLLKRGVAEAKAADAGNVAKEAAKAATETAETPADTAKENEAASKQVEGEPKEAKADTANNKAEAEVPEGDDDLSQDTEISSKTKEKIQKRIDKEVAKRGSLERELAALKAQVAQNAVPPPPVVSPTPDNPLANVVDVEGLKKEREAAFETKEWAEMQLDREDIDWTKGLQYGDRVYSKQELKLVVRNAARRIDREIPERAQFLTERTKWQAEASQKFTWLNEPTSKEFGVYQQMLRDPDIAKKPNAPWLAAAAVYGHFEINRVIQSKGTKPVSEAQKQRPPLSQVANGGGAFAIRESSGTRAQKELEEAYQGLRKAKSHAGNFKDVAKFLQQREKIR